MLFQTDIRLAGLGDLETLRGLSIRTFGESFADVNSPEDMAQYLRESFDRRVFEKELQDPQVHYYLLYIAQEPVAYLKLNSGSAQKEAMGEDSVEIERIYVSKEQQGKELGAQLLQKALDIAAKENKQSIWLGVWEKNFGAIRFYERHGFKTFGRHTFVLGTDKQTDLLMKRSLVV